MPDETECRVRRLPRCRVGLELGMQGAVDKGHKAVDGDVVLPGARVVDWGLEAVDGGEQVEG